MEGPRISLEGLVRLLLSSKDRKSAVFYATVNNSVVGCIHAEQAEEHAAEFGLFAVDPELQSAGIGRSEPSRPLADKSDGVNLLKLLHC
jgi:hypothetical protein